jgi:hypothetical protein
MFFKVLSGYFTGEEKGCVKGPETADTAIPATLFPGA